MLIGRQEDEERLSGLLVSAREGLSATLVLRGDPGIGKTALLEALIDSASDMHLLKVAGIESEMELPYAALHRLLLPILARRERLPGPQREALGAAFGLVSGPAPDKFLVGLGVLTLVSDVAVSQPVLCAVDDTQWLDSESAAVLAFVARRLLAEGVVMIFSIRGQLLAPDILAGLPELVLDGLSEVDALALLDTTSEGIDRAVAHRILAEASGNPLAVIEFARRLTPAQLSGERLLVGPLPIARRLESHFREQVDELPAPVQTLLLIASAEPSGEAALIWRAAIRLGVTPDELAGVDLKELVSLSPSITFRHPLIRSAVYSSAGPRARREAHGALAKATDERDLDRRAWHRASAATGPDEQVATELEASAERARARGGLVAEAAFMTRAGELTAESSLRGSRLLAAAQASLRAADVSQAQALLRWAAPDVTTPLDKAQAEWLQGAIYAELGSMGEAAAVIASSARALQSIDGALAKLAWLESFDAAFSAFLLTKGLTLEHIAEAVLDTPLTPLDQAPPGELLLRGLATRIAVGSAQAAPTFQRLFELVISSDDFLNTLVSPVLYSVAISEMWDWDRGKDLFLKIANYERTRGGLVALRHSLHSLFNQEVWTGRFSVAEEYWNEALDISAAVGGDFLGEYMNFELKAFQGDDEAAEAAMAIVRPLAESVGYGVILGMCATAKCILGLARGRYEEAVEHASVLFDHDLPGLGTRILPELIEAASRCGQIDLAAAALTRLEERARSSGTSWALTALARSQALLASDEDADSFYEQAIRHGEDADRPLDVARARLLRGEWLRRRKQRVSAREELRLAYEALSSMGAKGFAERAATELRATGGRARKRTPETANNLTAQEMQVARLAATGAVNREIAGELFISETTVAYHLRKVFKKLAVTSRRQLATALAEAAGRTN